MKIKIKMPSDFWVLLEKVIEIEKDIMTLNFERAFGTLFENAFAEDNTINNLEKNCADLKAIFVCDSVSTFDTSVYDYLKENFKYQDGLQDIDPTYLLAIANKIEFVIRIWLGQWRELDRLTPTFTSFDDKINIEIARIRSDMLPIFIKNDIVSPFASFGIYSSDLNEDIRKIYAIMKKFRFALTGNSDDSYICKKDYTKNIDIQLPNKGMIIVGNDLEEVKEFLDSFKEEIDRYRHSKLLSYVEDNGRLFVYINERLSIAVEKGTKIIVNYNRWPEIYRDNMEFDFYSAFQSA